MDDGKLQTIVLVSHGADLPATNFRKRLKDQVKILVILGTRPEAIKLAPVIHLLREEPGVEVCVCITAQHRQLLDQTLAFFDVQPDRDLNLMAPNQSLGDFMSRALVALAAVIAEERPDWIVLQGDTTTVLAGSMAAFYAGVPVAHVEAGLRSFDLQRPFPEEFNRRVTSIVTRLHLAPTTTSRANLLREGISAGDVVVTGNSVIDALLDAQQRLSPAHRERWAAPGTRTILLTCHRRENFGEPLERIFSGIRTLVDRFQDVRVVYPMHPNPNVRGVAQRMLGERDRIELLDPLDYPDLVAAIEASTLVITDSGGIQEEAPSLGKPVLVLRDVTERPEAVEAGTVRLVGGDGATLVPEAVRILTDREAYAAMARAINPYGDGQAAKRMVDALLGREVAEFMGLRQ